MNKKTSPSRKRNPFHSYEIWFFIGVVFYLELLLQLFTDARITFARFCIILFFSACYGAVLGIIAELSSPWRGKRALICSLLAALGALFATQYFLKSSFQTYMTLESILTGGGNVATEFQGVVFGLIFRKFWIIGLYLLPVLLYGLFGKSRSSFGTPLYLRCGMCLVLAALTFGLGTLSVNASADKARYHDEFTFDAGCQSFGLLTSCRLDFANSASSDGDNISFQLQEPTMDDEFEPSEPDAQDPQMPTEPSEDVPLPTGNRKAANEMDIDFAALAEETSDDTIAQLHSYAASLSPSKTNQYTGLFEGKNLIFITAEAFAAEVIDPELTPTLYRLANKGIVFKEYYQPAWGGSTSTGEYSNIMGLIPTDGVSSIQDTIGHNMYFTLGNQLQRLGYHSAAYHNGTHTYYDRDQTHCNLGYSTFTAIGNGLEEGVTEVWPESDLEMIDFTLPQFIDKQPFSVYYMTVSGHCNYNQQGNAMVRKNYETVANMDASEAIKCYMAANLELENAMASLVKQLEDAGIADDTVIVMGTDHYPYGLELSEAWGNDENYLIELYGYDPILNPEQDHSALIVWSGCLEDQAPIVVDTPVYSLDIVPTLSNLFGLEYDSRLLVGRDVFSNQQPLVIWGDYSWLTEKGYYSTSFGTFTPEEGAAISNDYVDRMKATVANKFTFSRGVLDYDYYGILFGEDDVE